MDTQMTKYLCLLVVLFSVGCGSVPESIGPETTGSQQQAATCGSCFFFEWASNGGPAGSINSTNLTIPTGYGIGQPTQYSHLCAITGITGTFSSTPAPNGSYEDVNLGFTNNNNIWQVVIQNGGGLSPNEDTQVQVGCVPLPTFAFSGPSFTQGSFLFPPNPGHTYNRSNYFNGFLSICEVFGSLTTSNDYFLNSPVFGHTWSGYSSNDASHRETMNWGTEGLSWSSNPALTITGPYQVDGSTHAVTMPGPQSAFCALTGLQGLFGDSVAPSSVNMQVINNGTAMQLHNQVNDPHAAYPIAQAYCVAYH